MSAARLPIPCATCVHFTNEYAPGPPGVKDGGTFKCDAFPDGIPCPIQEGEFDHTKPFAGDHGITYDSHPAAPGECAEPANA